VAIGAESEFEAVGVVFVSVDDVLAVVVVVELVSAVVVPGEVGGRGLTW
jgi:hypothetical protein